MNVYTRVVIDIETGRVLKRDGWDGYCGPVAVCKGASGTEKNLANQQKQFYQTLTNSFQQMFQGQTAILGALKTAFTPILNAGPGQTGFTPQQEASIRSSATDTVGTQFANAQRALNAKTGSGETYLPSGVQAQLQAGLEQGTAVTQAQQQNQITQLNYQLGRENWLTAANVLGDTAKTYSPTSFASVANPAGSSAFESADTVNRENAAASPWAMLGGVAGSVLGSIAGPVGSAIGGKLGGLIGGGFGGGSASNELGSVFNPSMEGMAV